MTHFWVASGAHRPPSTMSFRHNTRLLRSLQRRERKNLVEEGENKRLVCKEAGDKLQGGSCLGIIGRGNRVLCVLFGPAEPSQIRIRRLKMAGTVFPYLFLSLLSLYSTSLNGLRVAPLSLVCSLIPSSRACIALFFLRVRLPSASFFFVV